MFFTLKRYFLHINIQHIQKPCRSFIRGRCKLCGKKVVWWSITALMNNIVSPCSGTCNPTTHRPQVSEIREAHFTANSVRFISKSFDSSRTRFSPRVVQSLARDGWAHMAARLRRESGASSGDSCRISSASRAKSLAGVLRAKPFSPIFFRVINSSSTIPSSTANKNGHHTAIPELKVQSKRLINSSRPIS